MVEKVAGEVPEGKVRFAAFEVDVRSRELCKHGVRVKLQDQPFKVLLALLEKPGEIVTREELRCRIWGSDTFVDFDRGLSAAVNRLRDALGDSADHPRYVETLARRGYRFIARVERPQVEKPPAAPTGAGAATKPAAPDPPAVRTSSRKPVWIGAAALAMVSGLSLWLALHHRPAASPPLVVRLTAFGGVQTEPSFSPDGGQVAFTWNGEKQDNWDIYVMIVGSSTALRLTSDPALDRQPAWSPDGRQIAFASKREQAGIYLVSPLGGLERRVIVLPVDFFSRPSWSPDGKFIVVSQAYQERKNDPENGAVWLIAAESGEARRILTPESGSWYQLPTFSPDGRQLVVNSCTGTWAGQFCRLEITALNAEFVPHGKPRQIPIPRSDMGPGQFFWAEGIAWTDEGASLLIAGYDLSRQSHLWRIPVGKVGEPQALDFAGSNAHWPATNARHHRLVFARGLNVGDVWRFEKGGKASPLMISHDGRAPQYSHDGRRIALGSRRAGDDLNIWTVNTDGAGWVQITSGISPYCSTPRWSPDDRRIAFDALGNNGRWDVWMVEANGGPARRLTSGRADSAVPSWSHDGKWIYFYSNPGGRLQIWRTRVQGGPPEQVTRAGGYTAFESTDGTTLYYTKSDNGDDGLFAMPLTGGEEKQVVQGPISARGFAIFPDGVYYLTVQGRNADIRAHDFASSEIRFHEFASGRNRIVAKIEGQLSRGFTVSPDRKTFLFSKTTTVSDLMMIEHFQ